jgi:uncharacterized membrane protein YidH (DUF202 family)
MAEEAVKQQPTHNVQTRLALERTRVAYDRTMMAWIRTATSLITFGFGVYKFFQLELRVAGRENQRPQWRRDFAKPESRLGFPKILSCIVGDMITAPGF